MNTAGRDHFPKGPREWKVDAKRFAQIIGKSFAGRVGNASLPFGRSNKVLVRKRKILLPIDRQHVVFPFADMIADAALHGFADRRP